MLDLLWGKSRAEAGRFRFVSQSGGGLPLWHGFASENLVLSICHEKLGTEVIHNGL